ncbi:restriction endonuclease subunit M [Corynebacterium diphtheriae]|nr:restriction endonuclease subunit M [Corynebacterium diphtheriae]
MLVSDIEARRLAVQTELDAQRDLLQRNIDGQFATPPALAKDVVDFSTGLLGEAPVSFLEPSCGSGAFYSALLSADREIQSSYGIEKDPRFATAAQELWSDTGLKVLKGDFFTKREKLGTKASLLIANPPYVRHHHLDSEYKKKLNATIAGEVNINISGLAGLYVYFLLGSHKLLDNNAVSAWLIPSEFLDTGYGKAVREYLATRVTINRIHRFDPEGTQFSDALVTSCVVVFTNAQPQPCHEVEFTQGGMLTSPEEIWRYKQSDLKPAKKWGHMFQADAVDNGDDYPRFDEFFEIKRGIATGGNGFFIIEAEKAQQLGISPSNVVPILPSPRFIKTDVIGKEGNGYADTTPQLVCIQPDSRLSTIEQVESDDPALASYLETIPDKVRNSYIVSKRKVWFRPETRCPAPFLMTYMGRGSIENDRPFKFLWNQSDAIVTNMFLMLTPIGALKNALDAGAVSQQDVFDQLRSITARELLDGGRVYGGGLRKVEPKELAAFHAGRIAGLIPQEFASARVQTLF